MFLTLAIGGAVLWGGWLIARDLRKVRAARPAAGGDGSASSDDGDCGGDGGSCD